MGDKMKHCNFSKAVAHVWGGRVHPQLHGVVKFYQRADGVMIEAVFSGLPEMESNFFALHIHEGGNCIGDGFPGTGGHYNPSRSEHPRHAGDLPPLLSVKGNAYLKVLTNRFQLNEVIGRTLVLHGGTDDFHTQPAGNAGIKIGCGVILKI